MAEVVEEMLKFLREPFLLCNVMDGVDPAGNTGKDRRRDHIFTDIPVRMDNIRLFFPEYAIKLCKHGYIGTALFAEVVDLDALAFQIVGNGGMKVKQADANNVTA